MVSRWEVVWGPLLANIYMAIRFFNQIVNKFLEKQDTPEMVQYTVPKKTVTIAMPYLGPLSTIIRRRLKRLITRFYPLVDPNIVFRRGKTIKTMFSYKDNFPMKCRSGVMYQIQCEHCGSGAAYVRKTVHTLHERFYGSNGHLNPSTKSSVLLEHLSPDLSPTCEFNPDKIKVLDTCRGDLQITLCLRVST